jgi:sensor histidine kinase YesM
MAKQWYNAKWAVVSFHILAWLLWFSLPILFRRDHDPDQRVNWSQVINLTYLISNAFWVCIFYLNANFLIPHYWSRSKGWAYFFILLVIFIVLLPTMSFIFQLDKRDVHFSIKRLPFGLIFPFMFIWAISTVYRLVSDKIKMDQLIKERENENLKTELSFLRSQVSPHFLFNVLNNMVALARLKSDQLEPSLIKLSGLMRYMLYESDEQKATLAKEIEYITSYIDLQRLRFGKSMKINVNMNSNGGYQLIEPMLLIPFIENAFKHGTGLIQDPEIDICLEATSDQLNFKVRNKYRDEVAEIKDRTSGIGLANVRRRLNLLYGKDFDLKIEKAGGWHTVALHLKLQ